MRRIPPMPQNVRLVLTDGTVVPVECVHAADEGDIAVWEVITKVHAGRVAQLLADVIPAKTAIRFPLASM